MRKSFLVVGLAVLLVSIYVLVVEPLDGKRQLLQEETGTNYANIEKYQAFVNGARSSGNELEAAKKGLEKLEEGVIREKDESLAFARLQLRLQDMAKSAGLSMLTIRPVQSSNGKGYRILPIYMEAEGSIKQLSGFLKKMDSPHSYMQVDRLLINRKDTGDVKDKEKNTLRIKMQVSGLMRS
ncbi:MAG: type II secretion system protein GspM [Nitrospiraceae bacterium]|nr:type II secretion system protein GspM [Nitrospiraceae bacterium]